MIPGKSYFPYLPLRNRSPGRVRTEAAFKSLESSAGRLKIQAFLLNESYPPYLKGFLFFNSTWGAGRERKIVQGLSRSISCRFLWSYGYTLVPPGVRDGI